MRGRTHPRATIEKALRLSAKGLSDYEVAERLDLRRSTVQKWRRNGPPTGRVASVDRVPRHRPLDDRAYAYLLGMYLGDGCLAVMPRAVELRVALDSQYPGVVRECAIAMASVLDVKVNWRSRPEQHLAILAACSADWLNLFPQHGPGKKHQRKIELVPWQEEITHEYTREFIRGLIHSDGSRCINRFSVKLLGGRVGRYAYPRYFFTNYSEDIRRIFWEHCELLGIHWTQSNWKNISVSHRDSVAILDSFVGPKT